MREFNKVSSTIWNSRKFQGLPRSEAGTLARYLYLYLITCPSNNSIGCYVCNHGYIIADTGLSEKQIMEGLELLESADLIQYDLDESLIRICNWLTFNPICNRKHGIGAVKIWHSLPKSVDHPEIKESLKEELLRFPRYIDKTQFDAPVSADMFGTEEDRARRYRERRRL